MAAMTRRLRWGISPVQGHLDGVEEISSAGLTVRLARPVTAER